MLNLKSSTTLVTGASRGLGAAYARELARRGANVVLLARTLSTLKELAHDLSHQYSVSCFALQCDLGGPDAVAQVVKWLDEQEIHIDLLINNAGLGLAGSFLHHDQESELRTIQVNVMSLVGLTHTLGRRMVLRGGGGIINVSSNAAFHPVPHMATYAAAKAFVLHFTEAVRFEMRASGVQVMAVAPGPIATGSFEDGSTRIDATKVDDVDKVVRGTLRSFFFGSAVAYPGRPSVRLATLTPRLFARESVNRAAARRTDRWGFPPGRL